MCCRGCKVIANVGHGDGQLGMRREQRGGISGCRKLLEGRWGMNQRRRRCVWWTWERRELRTTCPRAERSLESKNQMVTLLIWAAAEDFQHQHAQKGGGGLGRVCAPLHSKLFLQVDNSSSRLITNQPNYFHLFVCLGCSQTHENRQKNNIRRQFNFKRCPETRFSSISNLSPSSEVWSESMWSVSTFKFNLGCWSRPDPMSHLQVSPLLPLQFILNTLFRTKVKSIIRIYLIWCRILVTHR